MTTRNTNLLWRDFKGIRKLNSINSDSVLGADVAHNVRLSKEKSGQIRSIRSSGWFKPALVCGLLSGTQTAGSGLSNIFVSSVKFSLKVSSQSGTEVFTYNGDNWLNSASEEVYLAEYGISFVGTPTAGDEITVTYAFEKVIRLFSANISGYGPSDQLIAFTKTSSHINVWIVYDSTYNSIQTKIAELDPATDITDVCMTQWGDRLGMMVANGGDYLDFVFYATDPNIPGATPMGATGFYYKKIILYGTGMVGNVPIRNISQLKPYGSRLAVNGYTEYNTGHNRESIYGVWFSESGDPTTFSMDYINSATDTSAFYVETGEMVTKLESYHGLTAFCRNRSYNITGTSQNDYEVKELTAKGVFGNAAFSVDGKCAYIDSYSKNIFTLRDNIDGTIGFDDPVGNDIQDFLEDVENVTVNVLGRRVRILKESGQSLVYDIDIGEWTEEMLFESSRAVTFLNNEFFCCGEATVFSTSMSWGLDALQLPDGDGYFSHYRTNLIWLDSQSSVKSHLYPFAIILEPNTSNNFFVKFTTDRGDVFEAKITRAGYENVATYSNNDNPNDNSFFVNDDDNHSGKIFFGISGTELLVTVERPPFWRYLQIDIYTTDYTDQFNISGIEAKNTVITDEMLDY